jgi:hypothetical protein
VRAEGRWSCEEEGVRTMKPPGRRHGPGTWPGIAAWCPWFAGGE